MPRPMVFLLLLSTLGLVPTPAMSGAPKTETPPCNCPGGDCGKEKCFPPSPFVHVCKEDGSYHPTQKTCFD